MCKKRKDSAVVVGQDGDVVLLLGLSLRSTFKEPRSHLDAEEFLLGLGVKLSQHCNGIKVGFGFPTSPL